MKHLPQHQREIDSLFEGIDMSKYIKRLDLESMVLVVPASDFHLFRINIPQALKFCDYVEDEMALGTSAAYGMKYLDVVNSRTFTFRWNQRFKQYLYDRFSSNK